MIFGEKEVGNCQVCIHDVTNGHVSNWFTVRNVKGENTGSILLKFEAEIERRYTDSSMFGVISTHSTNNSVDIKDYFYRKFDASNSSHRSFVGENKTKPLRSESRRSETEGREREDSFDISESDSRRKLSDDVRIKLKEEKIQDCLTKISRQNQSLKREKSEIQALKQNILKREDFLADEKQRVLKERTDL